MSAAPLYGRALERREDDSGACYPRALSTATEYRMLIDKSVLLSIPQCSQAMAISGSVVGYENREPSDEELSG